MNKLHQNVNVKSSDAVFFLIYKLSIDVSPVNINRVNLLMKLNLRKFYRRFFAAFKKMYVLKI